MHRPITGGNKQCYRRQVELERRLHEGRLRDVKAVVMFSSVCPSPRSGRNLKYEAMTHDRLLQIDRENRILLNRLYRIMDRPPCTAVRSEPRGPWTLNFANRREEQQRIANDNKYTYQKITEAKPHLNYQEWAKHSAFYAGRFRNICERPAVLSMKALTNHKNTGSVTSSHEAAKEKAIARVRNVYNLAVTPRICRISRPAPSPRNLISTRKPLQSPRPLRGYLQSMDKDYGRSVQEGQQIKSATLPQQVPIDPRIAATSSN